MSWGRAFINSIRLPVQDDEDDDLNDDEDEHEVIYGRPDLSKRADQLL